MDDERHSISISSKYYKEIIKKIEDPVNGFSSVEDYVEYVLNEILFRDDGIKQEEEEKAKIQEELRKLGYI